MLNPDLCAFLKNRVKNHQNEQKQGFFRDLKEDK